MYFARIDTFSWCVSEISEAAGQGYCQGGFSADFTTVTNSLFSTLSYFASLFNTCNDQSFISQDGKVVLGGPGSFYWQGTDATLTIG